MNILFIHSYNLHVPLTVKSMRGTGFVQYTMDLHKTYGQIFGMRAGVQRMVFINDGKLLVDLYQREEFSSRPVDTFPVLKRISHGTPRGKL